MIFDLCDTKVIEKFFHKNSIFLFFKILIFVFEMSKSSDFCIKLIKNYDKLLQQKDPNKELLKRNLHDIKKYFQEIIFYNPEDLFQTLRVDQICEIVKDINLLNIEKPKDFLSQLLEKSNNNLQTDVFKIMCSIDIDLIYDELTFRDFADILSKITICPFLSKAIEKYISEEEETNCLEKDYEYIIDDAKNEAKALVNQIENLTKQTSFPPASKTPPPNFESDILNAISNNDLQSIQYLHEKLQKDLNVKDSNGNTPLLLACSCGNLIIVKYLLEIANADIKAVNKWKRCVLHVACANGELEVVKYLIENYQIPIDSRDSEGNTPLHRASFYGKNVELIKYLISKGANKALRNNKNETPYSLTCNATKDKTNLYQIKALLQI